MVAAHRFDAARRVVVTGMGVVSPIGETPAEFSASLKAGRSAITHWIDQDSRILSKYGGDLSDFDLDAHLERVGGEYPPALIGRAQAVLKRTPRPARSAAAAALQAYVDAGLPDAEVPPERLGHVLAGNNLNMNYFVENVRLFDKDIDSIDSVLGFVLWDTDAVGKIGELLTVKGPNYLVGDACASGNMALLSALDLLRAGRVDVAVVSAATQEMDPVTLQAWSRARAAAWRPFVDEPARASRPFDVRREGLVPGEAAGAVILETLAGARARGARIYAEFRGGAATCDASRLPRPDLDGEVRVMQRAMEDASIAPEQINYINAHATATVKGDVVEVAAIKQLFGDRAHSFPVNSTKSMIGHCLTAAGVMEFVAMLAQMEGGFVHPTINLEEPDEGCDLDFVRHEARPYDIDVALSNSFGFACLNACVVLGKAP